MNVKGAFSSLRLLPLLLASMAIMPALASGQQVRGEELSAAASQPTPEPGPSTGPGVSPLIIELPPASGSGATPQTQPAGQMSDQANTVTLQVGQSQVVTAPWPVIRASLSDPRIADVQPLTPGQLLLLGRTVGSTDLILWGDGDRLWRARVDVQMDLTQLRAEMGKLFPGSTLDIRQSRDVLVISGALARAEQVPQLHKFMDAYGVKYVDVSHVAGTQQVMLQVRVAEVSRTAIRALGFNAVGTGSDFFGGLTIGPSNSGPINPVSIGPPKGAAAGAAVTPFNFTSDTVISPAVTVFGGFPGANLEIFVQALAENQYMRILAEPNLVALSGETASFLAGGEYPIPVVQGTSLGATSITIEYREFGIRLQFRPVVLGEGAIRLQVLPEVSQLSDVGAVEIQGFRIPSIVTRRAETTLELKSGQTFGMAGLISQTLTARNSRVPGAGDIPVLGALFRSVRYEKDETELVVLVTASLVEPSSALCPPALPGEGDRMPNDWELYACGQIEGKPALLSAAQAQRIRQMGLNNLCGPGAWARYDQKPCPSRATSCPPASPVGSPAEPYCPASAPGNPSSQAPPAETPAVTEQPSEGSGPAGSAGDPSESADAANHP